MAFKDLIAQNLLISWLTGRRRSPDLAVSMAGVRLGEKLIQIGLGDASLFVALGGRVGYTGRAFGVDVLERAVERARRAAERAGVLVEVQHVPGGTIPLEAGGFDVAVVVAEPAPTPAPAALAEALRLLRPGGRCLTILAAGRGDGPDGTAGILDDLRGAGFRASRELARREGLVFLEATKTAA